MIEAMSEIAARPPVGEASPPPATVDNAGSAEFDEAMAGALRPPEGGCQCDARASMETQASAAPPSRATPSTQAPVAGSELFSVGDVLAAPSGVDRSTPTAPDAGEPTSCGACGLPFSLDDAGSAIIPAVSTAPDFIGIPTGWTFAGPSRPSRPATFEA